MAYGAQRPARSGFEASDIYYLTWQLKYKNKNSAKYSNIIIKLLIHKIIINTV
jgi:hypothetical protein